MNEPSVTTGVRRSRRGGLRITIPVAILLVLVGLGIELRGRSAEVPPRPTGPNVLLLVMDTTRGDRCSINGYPRPTTPRLARFAQDAVVYRRAYVPAGWTGPSHASLFTGLRPDRHGFLAGVRMYLAQEPTTLAEALQAAGWRTAAWSSNAYVTPDFGFGQGFEQFRTTLEPPRPRGLVAGRQHRLALEFMKATAERGEPFFVFVNDIQPHAPYVPPPDFQALFVDPAVPAEEVERARWFDPNRAFLFLTDPDQIPPDVMRLRSDLYDAEIASLDASVGDFLDGMEQAGLLENTIVIVTSDHGEHFGEAGRVEHLYSLHLPILHVPLVVRVPGRLAGGIAVDDPVRLEDLAPTILEACGLDVPPGLDGESLFRLDPARPRVARASYGRQPQPKLERGQVPEAMLRGLRSVLDGRWHLIRDSAGVERLYDIEADPSESNDRSGDQPDVCWRLRELLPER